MIAKQKYDEALVQLLQKYPDFPEQEKLLKGFTVINAVVVAQGLQGNLLYQGLASARDDREEITQTPFYRQLGRDKAGLYNARAKLSNSFHKCHTDEERAQISSQIQEIQQRIDGLQQFMRDVRYQKVSVAQAEAMYTREEGEKEQKGPDLESIRAMSDIDLMKRRNSIRVRISQVKRKLEDLSKLSTNHNDRRLIPKYEAQLRAFKIENEYVSRCIDERKAQHPGVHAG
jgi:hypothetical protein